MQQDQNAMNQSDRETIQMSIEDAQGYVERAEKLERLLKNQDFIDLFTEGYCEKHAAHLVRLTGDVSIFSSELLAKKNREQIAAIGWFQDYIRNTLGMGRSMKDSLRELRKEEEMLDEEEQAQ